MCCLEPPLPEFPPPDDCRCRGLEKPPFNCSSCCIWSCHIMLFIYKEMKKSEKRTSDLYDSRLKSFFLFLLSYTVHAFLDLLLRNRGALLYHLYHFYIIKLILSMTVQSQIILNMKKNVTMTCFCRLSGDEKDLCIWGGGVYGGELNWIGFLQKSKANHCQIFNNTKELRATSLHYLSCKY